MTYITARYPQQMAWATLLAAFVTLCLLLAGLAWGVQWVLYESTIDLRTTVKVSRGTIGYTSPGDTERVVRDRYPVLSGDLLRTDELSQGNLTITDPLNDDQVLATVQILGGSGFSLASASRPRFGVSDNAYSVVITDAIGKIDIIVNPDLEREFRLEVQGRNRHTVRLDSEGYYRLQFNTDSLFVVVELGQALVVDRSRQTKLIEATEPAEKWAFGMAGNPSPHVASLLVNLLANPMFLDGAPAGDDVPDIWGCGSERPPGTQLTDPSIADPFGTDDRVFLIDRYALRLQRVGSEPVYPRDTICRQLADRFAVASEASNLVEVIITKINQNGEPVLDEKGQTVTSSTYYIDVSKYTHLYVRASIYIASHSLSGCGQAGSECAVMLKMPFKNSINAQANTESAWIQGFYAHFDQGTGAQIQCLGCQIHEHVNANTWYTFESNDFMLGAEELQPVMIREISVYASGHLYESYVGEISLIAEIPVVSIPES